MTSHDFAYGTSICKWDYILFTPWNYLVLLSEQQWRQIKRYIFILYFYFFRLTQPQSKLTCTERKKQRYKKRLDNNIPFFTWDKSRTAWWDITLYCFACSFIWNNRRSVVNRLWLAKRKVSKQRRRK